MKYFKRVNIVERDRSRILTDRYKELFEAIEDKEKFKTMKALYMSGFMD